MPDEHKATSVETTSVSWSYGTSQTIGHGITEVRSGPGCSLADLVAERDQRLRSAIAAELEGAGYHDERLTERLTAKVLAWRKAELW